MTKLCPKGCVTKWCVKDGVRQRWCVKDGVCVTKLCVCGTWCVTKMCDRWCVTKLWCDKAVCERWCVTKRFVNDGVRQRWCVTKVCVKDVCACERWSVTKTVRARVVCAECQNVPRLRPKVQVDVTKCHACHAKVPRRHARPRGPKCATRPSPVP